MNIDSVNILQVLITIFLAIIGWILRWIWSEIKSWRTELREMRDELREDIKTCMRERECAAHRAQLTETFELKLEALRNR